MSDTWKQKKIFFLEIRPFPKKMSDAVRVAPFTSVPVGDVIKEIEDNSFKTCFCVLYDCDENGLPDLRKNARSSQSNILEYLLAGMMYTQSTLTAKSNSAYMPPPRSFVVMHRLTDLKWIFIVIVTTKIATAFISAKNLFGIMCPKQGGSKVSVPEFMQTQLGFLDTLRCSINAADSPLIGVGPKEPPIPNLRESSNLSGYQIGFADSVKEMKSVIEIIAASEKAKVLNPFLAFRLEKFVDTLEHIGRGADFGAQLEQLAKLLFFSHEDIELIYEPTILEMSLTGLIELFSGVSVPPICLPNSYVDDVYKKANIPVPNVSYDVLLKNLIDGVDPNLKINVNPVSFDERYLYPSWYLNMDYMARFNAEVKSGKDFEVTLLRAFQRMMTVSDETPLWVTEAALGLLVQVDALHANCNDAGISRIEFESWRNSGDHTGFCNRFAHIQFFITGSFSWSLLPPAKMIINFVGPKGCGKTYAKSFFMKISGLIPCVGKHQGSAKAEYVLQGDYHRSQDLHITTTDDSTVGMPTNFGITTESLSLYKQMFDVQQFQEKKQIRSVVSLLNSNKRERVTLQVQRDMPGAALLTNQPIFVNATPGKDDESLKAIQSRVTYLRMYSNGHISPCIQLSSEGKADAMRMVVYEMHMTTIITAFQASLGILPSCPLAESIFDFVTTIVQDLPGSQIHFNERSRAYVRFTRTLAILVTRAYVWRVIATGCDGAIESICDIIKNGLHLVANPIECIQAVFLVLNGSHCSVPLSRLLEHEMLDVCASLDANFYNEEFVVSDGLFVNKAKAIGAATELAAGRSVIDRRFIFRGVMEPSVLPNVLDVALASLVFGDGPSTFTSGDLRRVVKNPAHFITAFRLLWVYSRANPDCIIVQGNWIEHVRSLADVAKLSTEIIVVKNFACKLFTRAHPSVLPLLDLTCWFFKIDRQFHVCTEENREGTHEWSLPGLFYYKPPFLYSTTPVIARVIKVGQNAQACSIPIEKYWEHEMWGSETSLGAVQHRELHPYLPRQLVPNRVPTARAHFVSVQGNPPYQPMKSRFAMDDEEIAYDAATCDGFEAVGLLM